MISKLLMAVWTVFVVFSFMNGVNDATKLASGIEYGEEILPFAIMTGFFLWFAIWLVIALPIYMISRMFQRYHVNVNVEQQQLPAHAPEPIALTSMRRPGFTQMQLTTRRR